MVRPLGRSKSFRETSRGTFSPREPADLAEDFVALPSARVAFEPMGKTLRASNDQAISTRHPRSRSPGEADRPSTSSGVPRRDKVAGLPANPHPLRQSPPFTTGPSPIPRSLPPVRSSEPDTASIGMALGSPRADRPLIEQLPYGGSDGFSTYSSSTTGADAFPGRNHQFKALTRQKSSGKWKLFGGMFGKRASSTTGSRSRSPLYQLAQSPEPPTPSEAPQAHRVLIRSPSSARSLSGRGQKPRDVEPEERVQRVKSVRQTAPRKLVKSPSKATPRSQILEPPTPSLRLESSPMLDVDIPRIEMERYSVMFGSLLKPRDSSLLTRRQATLEKLKDPGDPAEKEGDYSYLADLGPPTPGRRSSSSPSFSLFPVNTISNRDTPPITPHNQLQSQLHRSNTSPSSLSPSRLAFEHIQRPRDGGIVLMVHSPARENAPRYPAHWAPYTPRASPLGPNPNGSQIDEEGEVPNYASGSKWDVEDHLCETITEEPPSPPYTANEISTPHSQVTDVLSEEGAFAQISPSTSSQQLTSVVCTDARIKDAVEVSIARQISRSRSQREMLLPIVSDSERPAQRKRPRPVMADKPVLVRGPARMAQVFEYEAANVGAS